MAEELRSTPIVTLTTDFGTTDTYVGQMKGVILGICPDAQIVDVTHDVRPQQIRQGAFLAQTAWPVFPSGVTHVAVVDPGVGTERRGLALVTDTAMYVGPDNGILSAAFADEDRPSSPASIKVPEGVVAYEITNAAFMQPAVSSTFHGRDVFSPTAAHLAIGAAPDAVGSPVAEVFALPAFGAKQESDGSMSGEVVHIDYYGNAITDIRSDDLPDGGFVLDVIGHQIPGPFRTFADLREIGAIIGGSGYLGIAAPQGNAAELLSLSIGVQVRLRSDG